MPPAPTGATTSGGRHAAQVAAGILVTRVLGYVRERVTAYYLGNGAIADAFRIALRIPNAIRSLLGEGTLSASFIPAYASLNERQDKSAARALAGAVAGLLLLAAGVLAVVGVVFAPQLTSVLAPGLAPETRTVAVTLMRLLFPMSGLMVCSAWCLGVLNSHRRFFLPYAAPAMWNVAGIAALVAAATWFVDSSLPLDQQLYRLALALAWGTVVGSVLQVAVQIPACWRLLGGIALRMSTAPEGVRQVLVAWAPLVLGAGVAQLSSLVDTFLGSLAGPGGVSSLAYAQLIQVLPVSLFGTSVAAVSLPDLSRDAAATTPNDQLRTRVAAGFRRITYFVMPSAVAFAVLGPVIVAALFQTGRFGDADTLLVGGVLAAYGVGLLGQTTVKLFASGFYALRDTKTPVKIASFSLIVSGGLAYLLLRWYGTAGIAFGSSLGATLNVVLHLRDLDKRIGRVLGRADWQAFGISVVAALLAGAAAAGTVHFAGGLGPIPRALGALGIFGVSYAALTLLMKHPDAARIWTYLR